MESVSPRSVLLKANVRGFALYCVPYDCYIVTFKYLLILKYISKINEKKCLSKTIFYYRNLDQAAWIYNP